MGRGAGNKRVTKVVSANPFERFSTKSKGQQVLGRKIKGTQRSVSASKSKAIKLRQQSLQEEFNRHAKNISSEFVDKRFGVSENDTEDAAIVRFQKERQKQLGKKKNKFSLEEQDELTHLGQSIGADNFDQGSRDVDIEEERPEEMEGGFDAFAKSRNEARTKREVMHEIIQKSKYYKELHQMEKGENEDMLQELNAQFDADFRSLMRETEDHADLVEDVELDEFDAMAKQLTFEERMRAQERTKTEEEIALEELRKLEQLEKARLERMKVPTTQTREDDSEDDSSDSQDSSVHALGDRDDEVELEDNDEDEEASASQSDESRDSPADGEGIASDYDSQDEEDLDEKSGENLSDPKAPAGFKKISKSLVGDIPYILDLPESTEAFVDLVADKGVEGLDVIIDRIRKRYHVSLAAENREKLRELLSILLDYYVMSSEMLCKEIDEDASARESFRILCKHVCGLAHDNVGFFVLWSRQYLVGAQPKVFSKSTDYDHSVVTPLYILLDSLALKLAGNLQTIESLLKSILVSEVVLALAGDSNKSFASLFRLSSAALTFLDSEHLDLSSPVSGFGFLSFQDIGQLDRKVFEVIERLVDVHSGQSQLFVLLNPIQQALARSSNSRLSSLVSSLNQKLDALINKQNSMLKSLVQKKKVVEIKMLEPKFDDELSVKPSDVRQLKRKLKSEEKGARKELRKDTRFLDSEKRKLRALEDKRHDKKLREVKTFLEEQARDTNVFRRITKRIKLRK